MNDTPEVVQRIGETPSQRTGHFTLSSRSEVPLKKLLFLGHVFGETTFLLGSMHFLEHVSRAPESLRDL